MLKKSRSDMDSGNVCDLLLIFNFCLLTGGFQSIYSNEYKYACINCKFFVVCNKIFTKIRRSDS